MSSASNTPAEIAVPFHGPSELAAAWRQFVDEYTHHGASTFRAKYAAMLDDIAFGAGAAAAVAQSSGNPETLRRIQYGVEDVARELSAQTRRVSMRPLHRAVESGLIARWLEVKRHSGLESSQSTAASIGVTASERNDILAQRMALLHSPEGALLAGLLRMAEDQAIRIEGRRIHRRYSTQVAYDEVLSLAHDVFDTALFTYAADRGTTFSTYVLGGLQLSLNTKVRNAVKHTPRVTGARVRGDPDEESISASLPDTREIGPSSRALGNDRARYLRDIVDELEPCQRDVLRLRFGLTDGVRYTLEEVSQRLGLTKQWVNVIEHDAIAILRVRLKAKGIDGTWLDGSDRGR